MEKIKCIVTANGTIIPIHNIVAISGPRSTRWVWTSKDKEGCGYSLTADQYRALLDELDILEDKRKDVETENISKEEETECNDANAPTGEGKYIDECLNDAAQHFFSQGEDSYTVADLFYAGFRCGKKIASGQEYNSIQDGK